MIDWKITKEVTNKSKKYFDKYPSSRKLVYTICQKCNKGRWIKYYAHRNLCPSCSQLKRYKLPTPKFVPESERFLKDTMIDRILTIEKFGYDPIDLKHKSNKRVMCICQDCGKSRLVEFKHYRNLCSLCSSKSKETKIAISCGRQGIDIEDFDGFVKNRKYCYKWDKYCRKSNREKYNNECFICGKNEIENLTKLGKQRKLSVHHIDMSKTQGCDGEKWKLVPVCLTCHNKIHNDLWIKRIEYLLI